MFSPSDLLYIVLAFCVLWLTAGLFWLISQIAIMLRNVNEAMTDARRKFALIEEAIMSIKSRVEQATSGTHLVFDGIKTLIEFAAARRSSKKGRSSRSRSSSDEE